MHVVTSAVAGASLFYLLPYSPDLNPIEMTFAKLKAILRLAAPRNIGRIRIISRPQITAHSDQQ